jgi:hypothetical protein
VEACRNSEECDTSDLYCLREEEEHYHHIHQIPIVYFTSAELEFTKISSIAVLLDLRNWFAQSPMKTIDLGPLTKKSNSLNL